MQQHILSKTRTDRVTEAATERFFFEMVNPKLKENSERSLKMLVKSLKIICETANF